MRNEQIITIPLNEEETQKAAGLWNNHFAVKALGLRLDFSDNTCIRAYIDQVQPLHRGGLGTQAVNGAILSALCDLGIGLVGIVNSNKHRVGTVQLNISFLKPLNGNKVLMEAKLIKRGKNLIFARVELFDEKDNLCAFCDGTSSIDTSKPEVEGYMVI